MEEVAFNRIHQLDKEQLKQVGGNLKLEYK